jgi:uncharacterized protein GlcG (DUF336 family)
MPRLQLRSAANKTSARIAATIGRDPDAVHIRTQRGPSQNRITLPLIFMNDRETSDMSPIAKIIAGGALAAILTSPAAAQGVLTQKNVSLGLAQEIANAALAKCRSMGFKISVSVVDRDGLPVIMMYDEGAGLNTREGGDRKAYTAAAFHAPSADFAKRMHDRPETAGSIQYSRVLALSGGLPIKVGNETIGAVGVSGTPGQDDVCSQAGIDKVADQLK